MPIARMSARHALLAALALVPAAVLAQPADAIWTGGPIVTVNDAQPSAEAVAVRGGKIVGVGARADIERRFRGPKTERIDLKGRTLLPGFIDGHGHMSMVGLQAVTANALPPPDGRNDSIEALQKTLREWMAANPWHRDYGMVMGFGYDDSQLKDGRHPTRDDLDAVSSELPVIVVHQSSHLLAVNSAALRQAGIGADTPDPQGGVIQRRPGSREPNGVLEETAMVAALLKLIPALGEKQRIALLEAGQQLYLRFGHTTAQDGRSTPVDLKTFAEASRRGVLKLDLVSYADALMIGDDPVLRGPLHARTYSGGFRIGGVKLNFDGSPQGKTAWLTQPYFKAPAGQAAGYTGYTTMKDDEAAAQVLKAFRSDRQLLVHTNGDAAIDQLLKAVESANAQLPKKDRRPVMIHGQTLREDQVDRVKSLGIFPSLFPMHTYYWGDWHRDSVLGPDRAANISPTGWLGQRGMMFSSHHDAPVALPDTMRVMSATVNRTTRSGQALGPEHRVEPIVAVKAMTLWAAYQHFEEKTKGSIEVGKLADLVVLSGNPLAVPRESIADLKVMETIKRGRTVWRQDPMRQVAGCGETPGCGEAVAALDRRLALYASLAAARGAPTR
ncbi:MAG: amidohydrolase [Burkholderiales bacterium]|nr:amidohydrolase [Burkholderiales bacterium]